MKSRKKEKPIIYDKTDKYFYLTPEILCHPNIPPPLHGISPRTIKGKEWWDIIRQEVYQSKNYHCAACGVHKLEAKKHMWLEAHEFWDINYITGVCTADELYPLCHYCHNFIHSGRLAMIRGKEKSREEVVEILEHGFKILHENNLRVCPATMHVAKTMKEVNTFGVKEYEIEFNSNLKWGDYKLVFEGKDYHSKFNSEIEWQEYYRELNKKIPLGAYKIRGKQINPSELTKKERSVMAEFMFNYKSSALIKINAVSLVKILFNKNVISSEERLNESIFNNKKGISKELFYLLKELLSAKSMIEITKENYIINKKTKKYEKRKK